MTANTRIIAHNSRHIGSKWHHSSNQDVVTQYHNSIITHRKEPYVPIIAARHRVLHRYSELLPDQKNSIDYACAPVFIFVSRIYFRCASET